MTRHIFCQKLQKEAPAMEAPPFPNELGERIHREISQPAWDAWLGHQTMLINEYRLSVLDPKSKQFLLEEMQKFLFDGGSTKPPGYTDEASSSDDS